MTSPATRVIGAVRSTTESVTTSETLTRNGTFVRAVTDAPTLGDVATRTIGPVRTAVDALTLSETATRSQVLFRTTTEAVSTSESAQPVKGDVRATTDAPTLADTATRTGTFGRTAFDTVTLSESADAQVASGGTFVNRTASESLVLAEAVTSTGGTGQVETPGGGGPPWGARITGPTQPRVYRARQLVRTATEHLHLSDVAVAVVEFTDDEAVLEMILGLSDRVLAEVA